MEYMSSKLQNANKFYDLKLYIELFPNSANSNVQV